MQMFFFQCTVEAGGEGTVPWAAEEPEHALPLQERAQEEDIRQTIQDLNSRFCFILAAVLRIRIRITQW